MVAKHSKKHTPLMTPGQLITAFIFSNILFLILGIAIGKGDFTSSDPVVSDTPATIEVTPDVTERPMDEFNSLEETSSKDKKEHIVISPSNKTEDKKPIEIPVTPAAADKKTQKETTTPVRKKESPPEESKTATQNESGYYLQLAATKSKDQAQVFLKDVQKKGYPASIIKGGDFYKVMVGPYLTRQKAERMKSDIDHVLKIDSWIKTKP